MKDQPDFTNLAYYDRDGPGYGIGVGCLLLAVLAAMAFAIIGMPAFSIVRSSVDAERDRARAEVASMEAQLAEAQAEIVEAQGRADVALELAEAQSDVLRDYSEISQFALRVDIQRAHPELYLREIVKAAFLLVLLVIAVIMVTLAVLLWRAPARAWQILTSFTGNR